MKAGWEVKPLGNVFEIGSSKRVIKSEWMESGVPFYRAREIVKLAKDGFVNNDLFISEEHFEALLSQHGGPVAGDLMVSAVGTLGICYEVKPTDRFYYKDASVLCFRPKAPINSRFVEYAFQTQEIMEQVTAGEGATVGTFTIGRAKSTLINLPPLEEQKRIVAVLDAAFEGLTRAKKNAEANLQNARELFEAGLKAQFEPLPDNWIRKRLDTICSKIGSGATPRGGKSAYKTEGVSLVRSLNIHDRDFRHKDLAFIDDAQADKLSNVELGEDDVLLNITGASVARCAQIDNDVLPARVNQHVAIIRPVSGTIVPEFLCYELTSEPFKKALLKTGEEGGATREAITKAQIQALEVSYPPTQAEQISICEKLSIAEKRAKELEANNRAKLTDIADLRQSLLQKAFAGELT